MRGTVLGLFFAVAALGRPEAAAAQDAPPPAQNGSPPPVQLESPAPVWMDSPLWGRTVASVAYAADGPVEVSEIEDLIAIVPGRPLIEEETGATVRNLYGTRRFSDVAVDAQLLESGEVAVVVYLWRAFVVRAVEFTGKFGPTREDLRRVVPLAAGDPFHPGTLEAGTGGIERRLFADGYIEPKVEPDVVFDRVEFTVTVVYRIEAGQRARITEPFFDGSTAPFTAADLAKRGKMDPGDVYKEVKARDDADRMRKFLWNEGYYRGSVELIAAEPTDDGHIRPVYRITVGPRYELVAEGIKEKNAAKQIRALLDYQSFDDDLLDQWMTERRDELQRAGHYRAKVTAAATDPKTSPVTVTLKVEPGPKYSVESVAIEGDTSVPEDTLRDLMVTRPKGLPVIAKGRLIDGDLEGDVSTILGYYQRRGWIDAKVTSSVEEGSQPDRLRVLIQVAEGPRAYVRQRNVEGAEHLMLPDLDTLLTVKVGEPFNPAAVRHDVGALTSRYRNTGWPTATVQDRYTISEDRTAVDVEYNIDEGERAFFGRTIIRGNAFTRIERIRRQLAWKEGEPFSEEKIADTQQNLARTGVFRSIDVRPQPTNPENQTRTIDVELTEARRISLLYGFGYEYAAGATSNRNDVFGIVGATYRNLFGRMQSASLEVQYAPISSRGYVYASFLEPFAFNSDVPINVVGFASRQAIQDVNIQAYGGYVETAKLLGKYWRLGLRYEYQKSGPQNASDLSTIELERFPKTAFPIQQSAIGPSVFYDRRDDILDPHAGWYWTVAGKYAFPLLTENDARYGKVSGQAAWFKSLFGGVLALNYKIGSIFRYDLSAEVPVPIAERFYSGGSSTGRGFATDLLGIPCDLGSTEFCQTRITVDYNTQATPITPTSDFKPEDVCSEQFPNQPNEPVLSQYICEPGPRIVGGNGFMAATAEFRYPILGNLGISVFYDVAQVWSAPGDINFGIEGFKGLRQSVGAGIHYMTPVGPLRLEYARPVDLRTIHYQVTRTQLTEKGPDGNFLPCEGTDCILVRDVTVKETGRIFLSIGYPF
jgi:outer membrane protein insertion porin family